VTDSGEQSGSAAAAAAGTGAAGGAGPGWSASMGLLGLVLAVVGSVLFAFVIAAFFLALGVDRPEDSSGFGFAATLAQSAVFVAVALGVVSQVGRPTARRFGFRPFRASALGWALLAMLTYLILAGIYVELTSPPRDDLPRQFGADESTALAIVTGVLVIAIAPPVEEFFFRGFLYQALRARTGVLGGALISGLLFGLIHFKPEFLVPLAVLGILLALLFEKTGSLWPCILVHAANNAIAFSVTV
jgi:membrane protease YdiL (CAAX protease family)